MKIWTVDFKTHAIDSLLNSSHYLSDFFSFCAYEFREVSLLACLALPDIINKFVALRCQQFMWIYVADINEKSVNLILKVELFRHDKRCLVEGISLYYTYLLNILERRAHSHDDFLACTSSVSHFRRHIFGFLLLSCSFRSNLPIVLVSFSHSFTFS